MTFARIGVIVGRDLIGDALIKLPFARALRAAFPEAKIAWITSQGPTAYSGPLRAITQPLIDEIFETPAWLPLAKGHASSSAPLSSSFSPSSSSFPRRRESSLAASAAKRLLWLADARPWIPAFAGMTEKKEGMTKGGEGSTKGEKAPTFDLLIDTRGKVKEALVVRPLAQGGTFITPAFRYLFSTRRPSLFAKRPRKMIDRLLQMLELASRHKPENKDRLAVPQAFEDKAARLIPEGSPVIGLAPGAGNVIKSWPRERFIEVAQHQIAQGRRVAFLLGPDEAGWKADIEAACPQALFPLQARDVWGTEKIALEETLALGKRLTVALANDSGTSHMLAAVDCPLLSLFGPTSAEKLAPHVSRGAVIKAQTFGGNEMDLIPTEAVLKTLSSFL